MANEYTTVAALKPLLNIETSDISSDELLAQALAAASRGIDRITGRRFWLDPTTVQRIYRLGGRVMSDADGEHLVVDDIGTETDLVIETGTTGSWTTLAGYETSPENAILDGWPVTALVLPTGTWGTGVTSRVRVTARFGWPAVPDEVVQATQIQALRLYRRKDSPEGVTGSAEWGVVRLTRIDPDVQALIQHLMLPGFG